MKARGLDSLRRLPSSRSTTCRGGYLDPSAYARLGVETRTIDAVFNYPDGNEHALVRFWHEHGRPGSHLVFVTPGSTPALPGIELEVVIAIDRSFRVYIHRI